MNVTTASKNLQHTDLVLLLEFSICCCKLLIWTGFSRRQIVFQGQDPFLADVRSNFKQSCVSFASRILHEQPESDHFGCGLATHNGEGLLLLLGDTVQTYDIASLAFQRDKRGPRRAVQIARRMYRLLC